MKNNELGKKLGARIRELRLSKNIKQGELADMLDMERSNLTRIESGIQRPNDENLYKIARAFDVELKELFDFEHMSDRADLIVKINNYISNMNDEQVRFLYKSAQNLSYLRMKK